MTPEQINKIAEKWGAELVAESDSQGGIDSPDQIEKCIKSAITEATAELQKELDDEHRARLALESHHSEWLAVAEGLASAFFGWDGVHQSTCSKVKSGRRKWGRIEPCSCTVPQRQAAMAKFNALKAK